MVDFLKAAAHHTYYSWFIFIYFLHLYTVFIYDLSTWRNPEEDNVPF